MWLGLPDMNFVFDTLNGQSQVRFTLDFLDITTH